MAARDSLGNPPLHQAMAAGHERAMWALVDVGKADICAPNADGLEPLLQGYLALWSQPEYENIARTVCALVQCAGMQHAKMIRERLDKEVQKRWRRSVALVSAAADGDEERVVTELRHFADPDTEDTMGMTALDAALAGKHHRIVSILLEAGASHQKNKALQGAEAYLWSAYFY